ICEVCPLPSKKSFDLRSLFKLRRFCIDNSIDVVDAHSSKGIDISLMLKMFLPSLKLVVHRRTAFPLKDNLFSKRKYLNPKIDQFIAISDFIGRALKNFGVDTKKIKIAKSAVDGSVYRNINGASARSKYLSDLNLIEPVTL